MSLFLLSFIFCDFVICDADSYQLEPRVAFDGEKYLVVWQDLRSKTSRDIYGQFVSTSGTLIDTNFAICTETNNQWYPDVCFEDSKYFVVWHDGRNGNYGQVYGKFILPSGELLSEFKISQNVDISFWYPRIAWDSTNYFVVYRKDSAGFGITGQFVTTDGSLYGPPVEIVVPPPEGQCIDVVFGDSKYFVVWNNINDWSAYGRFIDMNGTLVDTAFFIMDDSALANGYVKPSVAFSGNNYLVVNQMDLSKGDGNIYGQLVATSGELLGERFPIAGNPAYDEWDSEVIYAKDKYFVVWRDKRSGMCNIYGQWISKEGSLIDTSFRISPEFYGIQPAVSCCSTSCLVVWECARYFDYDIYGEIIGMSGIEESKKCKVESEKLEVYPNPFTQKTVIELRNLEVASGFIPDKCGRQAPMLWIYDLIGRTIRTLPISINRQSSVTKITWDGKDAMDKKVKSGVYFIKVKGITEKLIKL